MKKEESKTSGQELNDTPFLLYRSRKTTPKGATQGCDGVGIFSNRSISTPEGTKARLWRRRYFIKPINIYAERY